MAADGLVLHRAGRTVLDGASLALGAGSVHALTAPSGAGKSTLLRCLVRLEEPEAGAVLLRGEDIRSLPAPDVRRRVAFVAQAPVMLPGTVAENLAYGVPELTDERRDAALAACALEPEFLDREARELSGGERARVAIARALTREPEALLFDEPTAALDAPVAERLAETIRGLAADGRAVLVATHDAGLVEALGGATFELAEGRVAEA